MDFALEVVVIPVSDVDRAKDFYADQVGFRVDVDDEPAPGFRVVQLTGAGSACSIILASGLTDAAPGSLKGLWLVVANISAARSELTSRGVDVTSVRHHDGTKWVEGSGGDWNAFAFFDDPDGNTWALQQRAAGT